jgi:flavodoxin
MNILIVYDSYFGNTEKIAYKIAETLGENVPVHRANDVTPDMLEGLDMLVLGSPTRAFKPSDATNAFLKKIPKDQLNGVKVAAFDTRMDEEKLDNRVLKFMVGIFGYAAKPMADKLVKNGGVLVGEPAGFIVLDSEGPLQEGELDRAAEWAKRLLA